MRSVSLLKDVMDKRLAGLSFLLSLGWATAVVFVMWHFGALTQRMDELWPLVPHIGHNRVGIEPLECQRRFTFEHHHLSGRTMVVAGSSHSRTRCRFGYTGAGRGCLPSRRRYRR